MTERPGSETAAHVSVYDDGVEGSRTDRLATEEPLEIRISLAGTSKTIAITMRTPGADFELAAGFLFGEGVVARREQIVAISYCKDADLPVEQLYNIVIVELDPTSEIDLRGLDRHFYTSSACGVCGKASLESISLRGVCTIRSDACVSRETILSLPGKLRDDQDVFASTGGLHAAGLFDLSGHLVASREDVGRHNAVDKLVGWALLEGRLPLSDHIMVVSGRSSFEILQKCATAGVPIVCSVSAPSSLAVDVARAFGVTLVGFLRERRFNVYAGAERIRS
ncbi:MAG TPA: formate dehydrogenase accessory sulfurtransferase FdhD [Actinomycetota bacterium]|nr:formate dehydrogenase accessory sulfurtransferase FdhD [Actinomycetota bacterium]